MDWVEIIHLRAYSHKECAAAVAAFHELTAPDRESSLKDVILLRNTVIDADMGIFIRWQGDVPPSGKSRLGLQLSAAFSEYGQIYYSVWAYETRLAIQQGKEPN